MFKLSKLFYTNLNWIINLFWSYFIFSYWNLETAFFESYGGSILNSSFVNLTATRIEVEIANTVLDLDAQIERDYNGLHFSSGVQFRSGKKCV